LLTRRALALRQRLQRLGEVLRRRVLHEDDVDLPLSGGGEIELLDQVLDALEALVVGDDDELVRALVGHHLREGEVVSAAGRRGCAWHAGGDPADDRAPAGPARLGGVRLEDLIDLLGEVLRRGIAHLDEADELARARLVERRKELLDAAHVQSDVGDDEDVGWDRLDVRALGGGEVAHDPA